MEHDIPMALHLDHGPDFETCKACIDGGFTSVMIDGSQYDFEKNVEITRQVVEYAHEKGVVVEGETGETGRRGRRCKGGRVRCHVHASGRSAGVRGAYGRGFFGHRDRNQPWRI
ncbi:MAG: class II fructose-bisphosphate aldolase [[Clostridium] scindens]